MASRDKTTMARTEIDQEKLRVLLRSLGKEDLLQLLDRAIGLVPRTRLPTLIEGYAKPGDLKPDATSPGHLLDAAKAFYDASHRGHYYETFDVNSKNFTKTPRSTKTWIAECNRLLDSCSATVTRNRHAETRAAFNILFGLLRHIDEGNDDIIFFADESGSWQVGVNWDEVLSAYFCCLATTTEPDEYARVANEVVDVLVHYDRDKYLRKAHAAGDAAQKRALRMSAT